MTVAHTDRDFQQDRNPPAPSAQTLCFVTRTVGEISETWMWRQMTGFQRLRTHVLAWRHVNKELFPADDMRLHLLEEPGCWPEEASGLVRRLHRLRNLPRWNFFATTRQEYAAIGRILREIQPGVMLCQYGSMGLRMLPIARRLSIPLVVHFHGSDLTVDLGSRWYRWSLGPALPQFDAIVVVNTKQKDWIVKYGVGAEKVHVIPCGVPTKELTPPAQRNPNGLPTQFIAVGRAVKLKGIDITIRAFAGVARRLPETRLVIVGDGPDREALQALARELGVGDRVCFRGWLSQSEVREELLRSDVFVQHSLVPEGWGVSVAEASATALPVVVTGCGGLSDQVVDGVTGLIVPTRDVRSMQEGMLKLARYPELRARMGAAGRERMVRGFDVRRQVTQLEAVLADCARPRGAV